MQYFKSIMPPKLGDVVDCKNVPINTKAAAYQNRVKKIFIKLFGGGMIEEEAYWELLWKMINNPYNLYGIVAIDGFANDMNASSDYGIYLNLGKPRLRARKYHQLKRIYAFLQKSGDITFFNSRVETGDEPHFMVSLNSIYNAWPADHPHISSGVPCLGAYQNDLAKWRHEHNPIMYLKTVNQFLNTWNARSAYYNINHTGTTHTLTKNKVKPRIFSRGTYLMYNSNTTGYRDNYYKYVTHHIFDIKSEDRQSELLVLNETKKILNRVRDGLLEDNSNLQSSKHINYINNFIDVTGVAITNPTGDINWAMINHGFQRRSIITSDRFIKVDKGHLRFPQVPALKSTFGILNNNKRYMNLEKLLVALARTMRMCIRSSITDESLKQIITKYENITIQKYIEKIVPIIIKKNQVYADLTIKHSLSSRVTDHSRIDDPDILKIRNSLKRKYKLLNTKLFNEIWKIVKDECNNLKIDDMLDEEVKTAFSCQVDESDEGYDIQYLYNKGYYYDFMQLNTLKDKEDHEKEIEINKSPTNFEELRNLYASRKKDAHLIFLEAEEISLNYKKRKVVESYGYNINSTKQDSTQVPLSFETIS